MNAHDPNIESLDDPMLEELDALLDGELSNDARTTVEARLQQNPAEMAVLNRLRLDRALRLEAFEAGGFDEAAIDRLVAGVRTAHASEVSRQRRFWAGRFVTSAAACLMVGTFVGWMAYNGSGVSPDSSWQNSGTSVEKDGMVSASVVPLGADGNDAAARPVTLRLYDRAGNLKHELRFATPADAMAFARTINLRVTSPVPIENGDMIMTNPIAP